jgi:protein TonB
VSGTRLRGGGLVLVSLMVHALAIVGVSALALRTSVAPLLVDLTQDREGATEARPGGSAVASSRAESASGSGAPARRATPPSMGAGAPIAPALPAPPLPERPPDRSASPAATPPGPPASATTPPLLGTVAPALENPVPVTQAVDPAPAPTDSSSEAKPSSAGTLTGGPASRSGASRAASAAPEIGGDGAVPGVSVPGGARLVLALPGAGRGDVPAEYGPYLARFRRSVEDALVYPLAARRQGLAGRVELDVLLEPSGHVTAVEIHTSSSHGVLDEAGIAAVRSLPPMPLPESLPRRPLRIRLPLDFQLR